MTTLAHVQVHPASRPAHDQDTLDLLQETLKNRIGPQRFELWFEGKTEFLLHGQTLRLQAANAFSANWIRTKFLDDVRSAGRDTLGSDIQVIVEVVTAVDQTSRLRPHSTPALINPAQPAIAPVAKTPATQPAAPVINAKYTLDEFVVGPCNQLAHHAACRVAEHPGQQYNPLFLHGSCGLGKTHLLQGICQRFLKLHPNKKALYITAEQFTNEFLEAIKSHKTDAFRKRIRSADLLVIDDIHFFANKKATQEEFLHTFNQIDAAGKQVVLASDCAPKHITAMADSLVNRFVSGMVVRIDAPDLPTRLEILRRKAVRLGYRLSEAVLMHIAQTTTASVRELEGLLMQVPAGMSLMPAAEGETTSTALAGLAQRHHAAPMPVPAEQIIHVTADYFGLSASALMGSSREKIISLARALAMSLARQHTGMSFPEIGRAFGNKNHSTVIAACQRIEALLTAGEVATWRKDGELRHQALSEITRELEVLLRKRN